MMHSNSGSSKHMSARWKILPGLLALIVIGGTFALRSGHDDQAGVEKTRLALRRQGFKTDLSDFNFSVPPGKAADFGALDMDPQLGSSPGAPILDHPDLLTPIGEHTVAVVWQRKELPMPVYRRQYGPSTLRPRGGGAKRHSMQVVG